MTQLNKILLGALLVQGVLVTVMRWPDSGPDAPRNLLGFAPEDIVYIEINGRKSRDEVPAPPVVLQKGDVGWTLVSQEGYPAPDALVQPTIDDLAKLQSRTLVATHTASHVNLEVGDDAFTRKLLLKSKDGTETTLYVGAGQGKESNVRVAGEEDVYAARGVNAWNFSENANRFFERDVLTLDPAAVKAVSITHPTANYAFSKDDAGNWTLAGQGPLDGGAAAGYLTRVLTMRMVDPGGKAITAEMGFDTPTATVAWTTPDGVTATYRIGNEITGKSGRRYLKLDGNDYVLEINTAAIEDVLTPKIGQLLAQVVDVMP